MAYLGTKPANQVLDSTLIADGTITTSDLANGAVTSAKMDSVAQYNGFKNRILNGDCRIDQRNNGSATTGAGSSPYTLDRWKVYSGGANCTVQRVAGFNGFQNALRVTGVGSNNGISVFQRIESFNTHDLASQPITVSFLTNSGVASRSFDIVFLNPTTTADDFNAQTEFARRTITVPNGIATHTVTVTASAGVIRGIQLVVEYGALTSGTIDITGIQLEKGTTATSFDYRPYGTELSLCQRYYQKFSSGGGYTNFGLFRAYVATAVNGAIPLQTTMRATPSSLETSAASTFQLERDANAVITTGISSVGIDLGQCSPNYGGFNFVVTGASQGSMYSVMGRGTTAAFVAFSSEL
jgi:hypothetical protein